LALLITALTKSRANPAELSNIALPFFLQRAAAHELSTIRMIPRQKADLSDFTLDLNPSIP
jgi:hypothetical protein